MNRRLAAFAIMFLAASLLWGGVAWGAQGDLLWERTFNYQTQLLDIYAIASTSSTVIVCGSAATQGFANSGGFIRAYDIASGNLRWEGIPLTMAATTGATNFNVFGNIMLNGNIALVMGYATSSTYANGQQTYNMDKNVLRAYNADTGQLLWEDIRNGSASHMAGSNSPATTANNRVFVSGCNLLTGDGFVRAYQISNAPLTSLPLLLE